MAPFDAAVRAASPAATSARTFLDRAALPVQPTGNWLLQFEPGITRDKAEDILHSSLGGGTRVAHSGDFMASSKMPIDGILEDPKTKGVILDHIGIAVLTGTEDLKSQSDELSQVPGVRFVMPDFYIFGQDDSGSEAPRQDTSDRTWGINAIGGEECSFSGSGIKLAILDTGFDAGHPDFDREIPIWSAFKCEGHDIHGHGTRCAGVAASPGLANGEMRYGVATGADLHVYKVLNDSGVGADEHALAAIDRAIADGCQVISMSFGRGVATATSVHSVYEQVAQLALNAGILLVAAAGNGSSRDLGYIAPVDYPANCPSIMAVAALDSRMGVPNYSAGGVIGRGGVMIGQVDIAAPGSGIFSSAPMPRRYYRGRGTSMAAPHVAGAACIWAEADGNLRGRALWNALVSNAKAVGAPGRDVGSGLVQLPFTEL